MLGLEKIGAVHKRKGSRRSFSHHTRIIQLKKLSLFLTVLYSSNNHDNQFASVCD
ncbi:hypothetical protein WAI453_010858 [Rhynchosporium graminicola]